MGNSSSSSKVRHKSDSMEIKYSSKENQTKDFAKSKSMMELGKDKDKGPTKRLSGSISERDKPRMSMARDSKSGSIQGISRTSSKSIRREVASHPITPQGREIITQCFENPHSEFGNKVLQRIFEKRADYQRYVYSVGKDRSYQMSIRLKDLVEEVVAKIYDPDYISNISRVYGEEHVELKQHGFKPDFWVSIADAITIEGVILDMANHQPADTVAAWSQLVSMMFSAVRDGYYTALRKHRMSSRKCVRRQNTVDSTNEPDNNSDSVSPAPTATSTPSLNPHTTIRSVSMYTVAENGTGSLATSNGVSRNGSINIMAPVAPKVPRAVAPGGADIMATHNTCRVVATQASRPKPIFE